MWPKRCSLATSVLWQVAQVSMTDAVFSCAFADFGLCTEWQVTHDRLRASCMLPFHIAWLPRVWQARHVSDASRGAITFSRRIFVLSPDSACSRPGP